MTFKITAEEKKILIKRRKTQGQEEVSLDKLKKLCSAFLDEFENLEGFDELESLAGDAADREVSFTDARVRDALLIAYNLQTELHTILDSISQGKLSNKFTQAANSKKWLIKLAW